MKSFKLFVLNLSHSLQDTWWTCFRWPTINSTPGKHVGCWGKPEGRETNKMDGLSERGMREKERTNERQQDGYTDLGLVTRLLVTVERETDSIVTVVCVWWDEDESRCCCYISRQIQTNSLDLHHKYKFISFFLFFWGGFGRVFPQWWWRRPWHSLYKGWTDMRQTSNGQSSEGKVERNSGSEQDHV